MGKGKYDTTRYLYLTVLARLTGAALARPSQNNSTLDMLYKYMERHLPEENIIDLQPRY
jgi:hypothetical protein